MMKRNTVRQWCPEFDKTLDRLAEAGVPDAGDVCPECGPASRMVYQLSQAQDESGVDLEAVLRSGATAQRRAVSRSALEIGKAELVGHPGVFTDEPPAEPSSDKLVGWEPAGHGYKAAVSAFRIASEADPDFADAGIWETMALMVDDRVEQAMAVLRALDPVRMDRTAAAYFLLNRSTAHRMSGDMEASLSDAASSADLRPDLGAAHLNVLLVCCRRHDCDGAITVLERLESLIQDGSESPGPLARTLALCPESLAAAGAHPGEIPTGWPKASPSLFADDRVLVTTGGGTT